MKPPLFLGKFLAKCVAASKATREASVVALASVAERFLKICGTSLVMDIRRIKESFLKRLESGADCQHAEAQKKLAAAADAVNKVTKKEHEDAMRALEREREAIRNRKLAAEARAAEARADKSKAEAAKAEAKALESLLEVCEESRQRKLDAAEAELVEALKQFKIEGGNVYIDSQNLQALLARMTTSQK